MREEGTLSSELFVTFLHWARAIHDERLANDELVTDVTFGMEGAARHGSCCESHPIEVEHEASVHEI
jgi:hypothetical protein